MRQRLVGMGGDDDMVEAFARRRCESRIMTPSAAVAIDAATPAAEADAVVRKARVSRST